MSYCDKRIVLLYFILVILGLGNCVENARKSIFRKRLGLTKKVPELKQEVSVSKDPILTDQTPTKTKRDEYTSPLDQIRQMKKIDTSVNFRDDSESGEEGIQLISEGDEDDEDELTDLLNSLDDQPEPIHVETPVPSNKKPLSKSKPLEEVDDDDIESFLDKVIISDKMEQKFVKSTIKRGDKLIADIIRFGYLGMSVETQDKQYSGLILKQELDFFQSTMPNFSPQIGDTIAVYVQHINPNGKLDLSLRPVGFDKYQSTNDRIIETLKIAPKKTLKLGDKSTPDEIQKVFPGMSKNVYKVAVSALLREGAIQISEDEMIFISEKDRVKTEAAPYNGKTPKGFKPSDATTIFVSNFPYDTSEQALADYMEDKIGYGHLAKLKMAVDRFTGRPTGYAYANFFTPEQSQRALKLLPGIDIEGRPLRVAPNVKSPTSLKHEFKRKPGVPSDDYSSSSTSTSSNSVRERVGDDEDSESGGRVIPTRKESNKEKGTNNDDSDGDGGGGDELEDFFADERPVDRATANNDKRWDRNDRNSNSNNNSDDRRLGGRDFNDRQRPGAYGNNDRDRRDNSNRDFNRDNNNRDFNRGRDSRFDRRDGPRDRDRDRGGGRDDGRYNRDNSRNNSYGNRDRRDSYSDRGGGSGERRSRRSDNPAENPYSVFVGGLPYSATESLVQQTLESSLNGGKGAVHEVRLVKNPDTQQSKGFGYVDFQNEDTARRAINELNGRMILGRQIKLDLEGPKHRPKNY